MGCINAKLVGVNLSDVFENEVLEEPQQRWRWSKITAVYHCVHKEAVLEKKCYEEDRSS